MSDKVRALPSDYVEAKKKIDEQEHTELYNAGTMNSEQYRAIIRKYAMRREALALAEGKRLERERIEGIIQEGIDGEGNDCCVLTLQELKSAIAEKE